MRGPSFIEFVKGDDNVGAVSWRHDVAPINIMSYHMQQ